MFRSVDSVTRDLRVLAESTTARLLAVAICFVGCSGGTRGAPTNVTQTALRTTSPVAHPAKDVSASATGRTKCTRRHAGTTTDGRDMIVYTEDTGACDPVRPAAVTPVAAR